MVAVLVAVVLIVGGDDDKGTTGDGNATQETSKVDITGDALPELGQGNDPAVGLAAPQAKGEEFGGNPVTLLRDGTPTMVVFAAHWCPHCQREVPLLVNWMAAGGTKGLDVVLVATATSPDSPNYPPSDWLSRVHWKGRVLLDDKDGSLAKAYGLPGYPLMVFVDSKGKVTKRVSGEIPIDQLAQYAGDIRA
jgi:thiol-disulfide isomerase/thioredoxin